MSAPASQPRRATGGDPDEWSGTLYPGQKVFAHSRKWSAEGWVPQWDEAVIVDPCVMNDPDFHGMVEIQIEGVINRTFVHRHSLAPRYGAERFVVAPERNCTLTGGAMGLCALALLRKFEQWQARADADGDDCEYLNGPAWDDLAHIASQARDLLRHVRASADA
ncbi:hypothetical protein [Novosphingobium mangrovi (ex Huang et al. 2023)]|uniref:Uncharacterized protein n=1 Tax=Novosphingobium mangrovi (ex Huang et al. 2023) TaxID=2976432 RepID=A0ABT2I115_9SPHN|nr:hypothetical protein [Novosphingobium mangrovi (ex Huang et al. 2023)]MCT2398498.1 hypothetical protein [Novosphingobium mangrovi (ex Huang et al. 2023)]